MSFGPKTRAEAEKENYNGRKFDPCRCAESVRAEGRWPVFNQCQRKPGFGPEGLYCKQHDPFEKERRDKERRAKWDADWKAQSSAITRRAAEALACTGMADPATEIAALKAVAQAAKALVHSQWQHRCSDKIGGCTAVSDGLKNQLEESLSALRELQKGERK